MEVLPTPVTFTERLDFFGNPVCAFSVEGPFDELVVTSTSEVSIAVRSPLPETGPTWEEARDVLGSGLDDTVLDARQYCYDSPPGGRQPGAGRLRGALVPTRSGALTR